MSLERHAEAHPRLQGRARLRCDADGIRNTLFGVSGRDPVIYVSVAILVSVVSMIATLVPARRATRVDPMIALRAE